jgi:signal transduction histidine kinase
LDTKSKKLTRSISVKAIAFIMVVILFTACVYTSGYLFYRGLNPEVLLVSEYKNSNEFENEVYNSLSYLENTLAGNETYREISDGAEYYISDDENIYKSAEGITPENIKNNSKAYFEYVEGVFYQSEEIGQDIRYFYDGDAEYNIYLSFSEEFLGKQQSDWEAARNFLIPIVSGVGLALTAVLGLVMYLLVATGKKPEDEEIHLNFVDKIYTEIFIVGYISIMATLAVFFSEVGLYTSFRVWEEGVTLISTEIISLVILSIIASIATITTGIFLLSTARRLKARMFFKGSLIYKFFDKIVEFGRSFLDGSRFERFPLTKTLHQRQVTFVVGSFILVALTFLFLFSGFWPLIILPPIIEVVLIYWYFKYNKETFEEINKGFDHSIEEQMKAERLKVNLVTNVSHDLKTPLTSIISYLDLLSKEDLSDVSRDYVSILVKKSDMLKNMVADLFDLAKSTSGDINLDLESLDLKKLLEQTLADMSDNIIESNLQIKSTLPEEPVMINSDGKKLYRVVQNLIDNALKYSLEGTRIFIELTKEEGLAKLTLKNTASYEMNFSKEDILQRFYRGEESRTGEGSGLGLSIAESFTSISGGSFDVEVDGDQFKVCITFRIEE